MSIRYCNSTCTNEFECNRLLVIRRVEIFNVLNIQWKHMKVTDGTRKYIIYKTDLNSRSIIND